VKIDGWLIRPAKFDPAKKYPVIVSVYGEPASTTVNDSWGGGGRMLMAALADDGYLIASFDNRGTPAPKGRAWRKVVYGSIGVLASKEQAAALRALAASHPYVDLSRVGVYGWSGGGSTTRSTRSGTWACPRTTPKATRRARPSPMPRGSRGSS
jgi:dipeptidyl-peptidase-4